MTLSWRFAILFLAGSAALPAQDTTGVGSLGGVVRDAAGRPAANVEVCVAALERCVPADANGRFRLGDLRPGEYALEVRTPERPPLVAVLVEVRAGLDAQVEAVLPDLDSGVESVEVTASAFVAPEEVKTSGFLVQRDEVFKTAGSLQDVSRYIQTLPGVAVGSDDLRNDIIVRGGSPLENLFIVDNIEIPNINAFANFASAGGTVGILDAALLQDVTFLTGGYPAPYINRTSSVLQVAQREGDRSEFHGRATLGFAGAGGILEGPLAKGKGSWIVSARRSFLDLVTDDVGFGGVPVLYTFNAKAVYDLNPRDRIWAVSIAGLDNIRLGAREGAANEEEVNNFDIRYRGRRAATGFNWQRLFGARGVGLLGVTHSEATVDTKVRDLARFGAPDFSRPVDELIAASPLIYSDDSGEGESTLKYDFTGFLPGMDKIQAGGSYKIFRLRYRTVSPFGTSSPYSPIPDLNPFDLAERLLAHQSGLYAQATKSAGSRLSLTFGGRFDHYQFLGEGRFSPRAGASVRLTDRLSWRSSYGRYYQQPSFLFLNAFPENRGLIPFRADHYVTGLAYSASPTLRITLEGYRKDYKDYPVATQFPALSLASLGDTFRVRDILFPLTSAGRGEVRGIELLAEKKFSERWFGQANVAFSNTRHAALDGILRPGSFDYRRVFNAVGGYRLNRKWEVSGRFSYLTGRPFTPFDAEESRRQRRAIFDLSRVNAERLPDYVRLDLRADRTFYFEGRPLLVFLGVQNVLDRRNVAGFDWNRSTNAPQENAQLGLFPILGLEWRF